MARAKIENEFSASSGFLSQGSKGSEVLALQKKLKDAGFDPGPIDADFGPQTGAALQAFQQGRGLEADAILGPLTRNALSQPPNLTTPTDTAYQTAVRQAQGAGIGPERIDPAYVQAIKGGTTQAYTQAAMGAGNVGGGATARGIAGGVSATGTPLSRTTAIGGTTVPGTATPGATVPVRQTSNIAGLFNLPTGTQYAPPGVTVPNITTPTFTAPGATPQAPAQQVTPERQALLDQLNRIQQNNNPQVTYPTFNYQAPPAMTYEEAQRRAAGQLNPQYQEALTDRMAALSTQMRQTGMYGQAPTIPITQEAAARIEAARMGAVGGQANVLMSQASQEALQQRQLAQSQWGQETTLALQAQGMNADEAQRKVANILAVASAVDQQRAQEAGLTGYYGGAPTMQRAGMEAELTGMYGGAETWGRQAQRAQLALSAQTAQADAAQRAQAQSWLQQVQGAGLTGVFGGAPTLEARSAQAAAAQVDIAARQRAEEFGWTRTAQEAGLTGAYGGQPTLQAKQYGTEAARAQAALDWQKQYQQGQLDIGRQPTVRTPEQQVSDRVANKYLSGATLTPDERRLLGLTDAEAELRERAVAAAQKDPGYFKTGADKAAIIQEYENFLRGGGAVGGVGGGFDLDQYLKGQGVPVK